MRGIRRGRGIHRLKAWGCSVFDVFIFVLLTFKKSKEESGQKEFFIGGHGAFAIGWLGDGITGAAYRYLAE
jgi:hypothetical protein